MEKEKQYQFINPIIEQMWKDRYQKNGETANEGLRRVANYCATTSDEAEQFYKILREGKFFCGGRTMSNAGVGDKLSLNNCFVIPQIKDDMNSIFEAIKLGALTHKAGGGTGYDFSALRPEGTPTNNDAVASGPISFMKVFDAETSTIQQGNRRGRP